MIPGLGKKEATAVISDFAEREIGRWYRQADDPAGRCYCARGEFRLYDSSIFA
jgi:hypothetical protein